MARIAFLGTGLLGAAFAHAAVTRGDDVSAWNRSQGKSTALAQFGVKPFATAQQAVEGASRVHLVLKDDAAVEEVIAAAVQGLAKDAILIDHSTTLPALTQQRAERFAKEGINYLHAPVFMGPAAALKALGSMMVSGPSTLFERVQSELAKMTKRVDYLGERADLAAVHKLFGNAMIIGLSALLADVFALAQATNVSNEDAVKLMGMLDLNAMVAGRGASMARGNFTPSFELSMARKDVGLMIQTAGARPLAALPAIAARMDQLIGAGHGDKDAGVLAINAIAR